MAVIDWQAVAQEIHRLRKQGLTQEAILALFAVRGGCRDRKALMDGLIVSESTAKRYERQLFGRTQFTYEWSDPVPTALPMDPLAMLPADNESPNVFDSGNVPLSNREVQPKQSPAVLRLDPGEEGCGEERGDAEPIVAKDDQAVLRQLLARWPEVRKDLFQPWEGEYMFPWTFYAHRVVHYDIPLELIYAAEMTLREAKIAITFAELTARYSYPGLEERWSKKTFPQLVQKALQETIDALERRTHRKLRIKSPSRFFQSILYQYVDETAAKFGVREVREAAS